MHNYLRFFLLISSWTTLLPMLETKRRKVQQPACAEITTKAQQETVRFDSLLKHWNNHPDIDAVAGVVAHAVSQYDFLKKVGNDFRAQGLNDRTYHALAAKLVHKNPGLGGWLFPSLVPAYQKISFNALAPILDVQKSTNDPSCSLAIKTEPDSFSCCTYTPASNEYQTHMTLDLHEDDDLYVSSTGKQCCIVDRQGEVHCATAEHDDVSTITIDVDRISSDMVFRSIDFSADGSTVCLTLSAEQEDVDDGSFSVCAYDTVRKQTDWLLTHQPHGGSVLWARTSYTGRYYAALTRTTDPEFKKYKKAHHVIHLYDRVARAHHTIVGAKKHDVPFRCSDVCISNDEKRLYMIVQKSHLYSIDLQQQLPPLIMLHTQESESFARHLVSCPQMDTLCNAADDLVVKTIDQKHLYLMRPKDSTMLTVVQNNHKFVTDEWFPSEDMQYDPAENAIYMRDNTQTLQALDLMERLTPEQYALLVSLYKRTKHATHGGYAPVSLDTPRMKELFESLPAAIQERLNTARVITGKP